MAVRTFDAITQLNTGLRTNQSTPSACVSSEMDLLIDRLGDMQFAADEILSTFQFDAHKNQAFSWIRDEVQAIYTNVNEIMKKITH